jgi:hypothetical protein
VSVPVGGPQVVASAAVGVPKVVSVMMPSGAPMVAPAGAAGSSPVAAPVAASPVALPVAASPVAGPPVAGPPVAGPVVGTVAPPVAAPGAVPVAPRPVVAAAPRPVPPLLPVPVARADDPWAHEDDVLVPELRGFDSVPTLRATERRTSLWVPEARSPARANPARPGAERRAPEVSTASEPGLPEPLLPREAPPSVSASVPTPAPAPVATAPNGLWSHGETFEPGSNQTDLAPAEPAGPPPPVSVEIPSGPAVIDLAIRESRLSPLPPRRRRVNTR